MSLKCVMIGAGNLATHLAVQLKQNSFKILQVYSRTEKSAKELADEIEASYTNIPEEITGSADIYFIALKDDAIHSVLKKINFDEKLVVHCAGSLPLSALDSYSKNIGVFYPLQTFSKNKAVNFKEVPIFIEANSARNLTTLREIAEKFSEKVASITSEQRMALHISAVFACNFTNHFYALADEILKEKGLEFKHIEPLIQETARKIKFIKPFEAQTGPAVRDDKVTIRKHVLALMGNKELTNLYKTISKSIFRLHKK